MSARDSTDADVQTWTFVASNWRKSIKSRAREMSWWYWLATGLLLAGAHRD